MFLSLNCVSQCMAGGRCDSVGLNLPLNAGAQSIQSPPLGMVFNPAREMAACVWHWKYQLICLKAITI